MLQHGALTERVIGLAIEVHKAVGPGLLESFYQECMRIELEDAGIPFQSEVIVPAIYKGRTIRLGFRADIIIANTIILEVKAATSLVAAHEAQILTYLRLSQIPVGLLMNFHAPMLKDGLRRFIM